MAGQHRAAGDINAAPVTAIYQAREPTVARIIAPCGSLYAVFHDLRAKADNYLLWAAFSAARLRCALGRGRRIIFVVGGSMILAGVAIVNRRTG